MLWSEATQHWRGGEAWCFRLSGETCQLFDKLKQGTAVFKTSNPLYTALIFLKGNLKQYLRLTTAARPPLPVLGIKKAVLDKAGLPDFARVLREGGFQAMDSKNTR